MQVTEEVGNTWLAATNSWEPGKSEEYQAILQPLLVGHECEYCGNPANTFDHVIPKSKNGQDIWQNLVYVCHPCNNSKGSKTLLQWIDHCNKMLRSAVRHDRSTIIWLRRLHGITGMLL
jgi:hypothetical protein